MKIICTLVCLYCGLFILLSHSALLTCRYGEKHMNVSGFNWKIIDKSLMEKCPKVNSYINYLI